MLFNCNDYFTSAIIILKPKQTVRIKLIKKFRYLSIRTTKTLLNNLFFTSDKIFGRPLLTLLFHLYKQYNKMDNKAPLGLKH